MNRVLASSSLLVLLAACGGEKPSLTTTVIDPWGNPVAGAQISVADSEKTFTTDEEGQAQLPLMAQTYQLTASGEAILPGEAAIEITDTKKPATTSITVIPVPTAPGYHLIGDTSYVTLGSEGVKMVGNELMSQYGVQSAGPEVPGTATLRVVFNTPLPKDELARLDLELHKLTFLEEMEIKTAEGIEEVEVDLWVSSGKLEFDAAGLGKTDDNYLFTVDGLEPGAYAFVSQGLLRPASPDSFANNPSKKVHPFRVK